MFLTLAALLIILWLLGLLGHIGGAFIYLLVVLALISVIVHFMRGGNRTTI